MIYLDFQATTPIADEIADVVDRTARENWANPSSPHMAGLRSQDAMENARRKMASLLGIRPRELFFTSGATEANNWVVSMLEPSHFNHIITTAIEHKSMLDACLAFEKHGGDLTVLPVDGRGFVDPMDVKKSLKTTTKLVSVMAANNETGSIQPLEEISKVTNEAGIALHSDATQAVGYLVDNFTRFPADLLSFSAHKLYGPKGVGALYISDKFQASNGIDRSLLYGGGQERGMRPGTENLPAIVGFAKALELSRELSHSERKRVGELKNQFWESLALKVPSVIANSPTENCLPNCLNVQFPDVDATDLMAAVPQLALSAGSACNSTDQKPSHVLSAMGASAEVARSSLRIGFGRITTSHDVRRAVNMLSDAYAVLKSV
ncbi:cysteine desulfurase family protein [Paenarthrobacter sp. NPDC058040]|uniref:cysteine desulfurase family protein n=1 Tax=unclassified Paenarthrobacter TaxID=2634190 RepID=UPI0036DA527F